MLVETPLLTFITLFLIPILITVPWSMENFLSTSWIKFDPFKITLSDLFTLKIILKKHLLYFVTPRYYLSKLNLLRTNVFSLLTNKEKLFLQFFLFFVNLFLQLMNLKPSPQNKCNCPFQEQTLSILVLMLLKLRLLKVGIWSSPV